MKKAKTVEQAGPQAAKKPPEKKPSPGKTPKPRDPPPPPPLTYSTLGRLSDLKADGQTNMTLFIDLSALTTEQVEQLQALVNGSVAHVVGLLRAIGRP